MNAKRIRRVTFVLLTAAMLIVSCGMFAVTAKAEETDPIGTAICTVSNGVSLRSGPSASYAEAGKLPGAAIVDVYGEANGWYHVSYDGDTKAWGSSKSFSMLTKKTVTDELVEESSANGSYETEPEGTAEEPAVFASLEAERIFTLYYQGDKAWKFPQEVAKKACLMTAYSITINNMGIPATPRTVYESNGFNTSVNMDKLFSNFGVKTVCALSPGSEYLASFDGESTHIINPAKNLVAAVKEALDRNPEGVIVSFTKGDSAHSIVACKYEGDTIYYSDPGRKAAMLRTFNDTWCKVGHSMCYANLAGIIALDK